MNVPRNFSAALGKTEGRSAVHNVVQGDDHILTGGKVGNSILAGKVKVEVGLKDIEIIDNDTDGNACGSIISIVYKGDHYQVIVRTFEEEEDFVIDTEYVWNDGDRVSVKIPKEKISLKLKTEDKK